MQTLSAKGVRTSSVEQAALNNRVSQTDVVSFVKDDNSVLVDLLRDLLSDLGIEEIVEGVYDDVHKWHLKGEFVV